MNKTTTTTMTAKDMKKTMLDGLRARGYNRAYAFVKKLEDPVDIKCAFGDYNDYADVSEFILMQFFLEVS